ncbi:MAG: DNA polymerase III subunit gamma/tau [Tissierellia bacterium]|nr:DNA polymerase III subunit gamma/tau [Tissierellia bacterium]
MKKAIYREYRPKTFKEVLGQKHITQILENQVKNDNIGHAYIFSGTRGTGKTSCAKILARAVNCLNPVDGSPCNECENCKSILNEETLDIVEMDAASNRRIDDIRELRDKVVYPPANLKYKVYIIDEAHMITNEGFNALLKIMEEPPKHLIFILATTEIEKIPQTILSRCQRYEFKRIDISDIK